MSDELKGSLKGLTLSSSGTQPKRKGKPANPINLEPKDFDKLAEDQGIKILMTPGVLCPNRTSLHDTNHTLDCPLCFGDEVIDMKCDAVEGWGVMQGIKLDKQMEVSGIFDFKDAKMTLQSHMRANYWYKIEIINFSSVFNQLVKRGTTDTDRLRYVPFTACDTPFLVVDMAGNHYRLNEQFKVEDQGIRWLTVQRPAVGALYSISYPILPTYRILELLHDNRFYYYGFKQAVRYAVQLPQEVVLRWDYLAKRSGTGVERV